MSEAALPLPFHRLFSQLQQAGVFIGPAEWLRVQHLLASEPDTWLTEEGWDNLKYQLAPLLCRNRVEQQQFYLLFDRWRAEEFPMAPAEAEVTPAQTHKKSYNKRLWASGLVLLAVLAWLTYFYPLRVKPAHDFGFLATLSSDFELGDTAVFVPQNLKGQRFLWTVYAPSERFDLNPSLLASTDTSEILRFVIPDTFAGTMLRVVLQVKDTKYSQHFRVFCHEPPTVNGDFTYEGELLAGRPIQFFPPAGMKPGWKAFWDFGDGSGSVEGLRLQHVFTKGGYYSVTLNIIDTTQRGDCSTTIYRNIQINEENPVLAQQDLVGDRGEYVWAYALMAWLLPLLCLGLAAFFFWKWWQRPVKLADLPEPEVSDTLKAAFFPQDRPPYAIPYRSNNNQVRIAAEQIELATALRRRQLSDSLRLDLGRSINATVEKAGFAELRFAANTRPTQYLFLIDQQNDASHQAQLFQHLSEILSGQEVLAEVFYYRDALTRFWNAAQPEGISLEHLAMHYGDYRLVIFGDAYQLLSAGALGGERLQPQLRESLKRWPRRMIVTPVPAASWSYKEARLYSLAAIFHAELGGLLQAAEYAEKGMVEEELPPTFKEWMDAILQGNIQADTNRAWLTPQEHREYLAKYQRADTGQLYRWLQALVVYPESNWNVSIAIGKSLGIDVGYEQLLILARIPWLQGAEMRSALWREWWQELSIQDEKLARAAVKKELEAVAELSQDGFAHQKLQTRLAVQDFALDPGSAQHQDNIRFILQNSVPSAQLREELNLIVKRHQPGFKPENIPAAKLVDAFVVQRHETKQEDKVYIDREAISVLKHNLQGSNLVANLLFRLGLLTGIAGLLLGAMLLFVPADTLMGTPPNAGQENGWLVYQKLQKDEARELNNQAVDIWDGLTSVSNLDSTFVGMSPLFGDAYVRLLNAIKIRPQYGLAKTNLERLNYNMGVYQLEVADSARSAITYFRSAATNDSLRLLALEALVLAYYRDGQIDSACATMQMLTRLDNQYFDWLAAKGECNPRQFALNILVLDGATLQPIGNARLRARGLPALTSGPAGLVSYTFPAKSAPSSVSFRLDKQGYVGTYGLITPSNQGRVDTFFLGVDRGENRNVVGVCRQVANVTTGIGYRNRVLTQREYSLLYQNPNIPLNQQTLIAEIPLGTQVELLDSTALAWRVRYEGQVGYIAKFFLNKPTLLPCVADRDGDGVPDAQDKCPNDKGMVNLGGCPDSDGDGVPNALDRCPTENGPISTNGCPDRDGDGVPDDQDKCPTERGPSENAGCPPAIVSAVERLKIAPPTETLLREALKSFDFDDDSSSVSRSEARRMLAYLGVSNIRIGRANAGEPFLYGQFLSGTCITIWVGTYEKTDRYGIRYGVCDENLSYHADNKTYLEILRPISNRTRKSGLQMVQVIGGSFEMGRGLEDESCVQRKNVDDFKIGKYEVTQADWREIMGSAPPGTQPRPCDDCPVVNVSWNDVQVFIKTLNAQTRQQYRLPTEAEWEYAARGGKGGKGFRYAGSNEAGLVAWYDANTARTERPVGLKNPNEIGLYDMSGNVEEWCADLFKPTSCDTRRFNEGNSPRSLRGGSWFDGAQDINVAIRHAGAPQERNDMTGFRLAQD